MAQICTEESSKANRRIPLNVRLFGSYKGHVWAILGPCFGFFYNIFASRCPKWLKFSLESHACQIERRPFNVKLLGPYKGHVWAILGPCFVYLYNIFVSRCLKWVKFSLKHYLCQPKEYSWMMNSSDPIGAMLGPYYGHVLAISIITFLLGVWNGSTCSWKVMHYKHKSSMYVRLDRWDNFRAMFYQY